MMERNMKFSEMSEEGRVDILTSTLVFFVMMLGLLVGDFMDYLQYSTLSALVFLFNLVWLSMYFFGKLKPFIKNKIQNSNYCMNLIRKAHDNPSHRNLLDKILDKNVTAVIGIVFLIYVIWSVFF